MSIFRWLVGLALAIGLSTFAAAQDNQQRPEPLIAGNPAVLPPSRPKAIVLPAICPGPNSRRIGEPGG